MTNSTDPVTGERLVILTETERLDLVRLLNQARGIAADLEEENARLTKAMRADVTPVGGGDDGSNMCGCEAHRSLVDCTCNCDHANDRLSQWKERALAAEKKFTTARAEALREAADEIDRVIIAGVVDVVILGNLRNGLRARADRLDGAE